MEGTQETQTEQLQRTNERLSRQVVMYSELLDHIIKHSREKDEFSLLDVLTMIANVMRL